MQGHLTRRRGSKLWTIVFHTSERDPRTGRTRTRSIATGTTSKREAQDTLARLVTDYASGKGLPTPPSRSETVAEYLERWLGIHRQRIRERTYEQYASMVRRRIGPALGHLRLKELRADVLQQHFSNEVVAKRRDGRPGPLSVRSVGIEYAVLRRALNDAVRWELLPRNPLRAVDPSKAPKRELTVLTPDEAGKFLAALQGHRAYPLFAVLLFTGLRIGEACGLRWKDVNLEASTMSVSHTLQYRKGQPTLGPTKTGHGRSVALGPDLVMVLRHHRAEQAQERLAAGPLWRPEGWVFTNAVGGPMHPSNLTHRVFYPALDRAGLPRIRIHDLRHTMATLMLAGGIHPKVVQERLGHSAIHVTMDTYSHVLPTVQDAAAEQLEGMIRVPEGRRTRAMP